MKQNTKNPGDVILVGNAHSLIGSNEGQRIDSFPNVVRFNGGRPRGNERSVGSKTTHWAFNTKIQSRYKGWVIPSAIPMLLNYKMDRGGDYSYFNGGCIRNDYNTYEALRTAYNHGRPSIGLMTAHFIDTKWECDIYAIGFDFFNSGSWPYEDFSCPINPHNGDMEREHMKSLGVVML